jgi:hypothetical protein
MEALGPHAGLGLVSPHRRAPIKQDRQDVNGSRIAQLGRFP